MVLVSLNLPMAYGLASPCFDTSSVLVSALLSEDGDVILCQVCHMNRSYNTLKQTARERDIDVAISKARILILLLKSELPEVTSSSMLTQMTERNDGTIYTNKTNRTTPKVFHEVFCKAGSQSNSKHSHSQNKFSAKIIGLYANRRNTSYRGFMRNRILQYTPNERRRGQQGQITLKN